MESGNSGCFLREIWVYYFKIVLNGSFYDESNRTPSAGCGDFRFRETLLCRLQLLGEPCRDPDVAQLGCRFGGGGPCGAFQSGRAGDPRLSALAGFSAAHGAHHLGADLHRNAFRRGAAARYARRTGRGGRGDDRAFPLFCRTGGTVWNFADRRAGDRVDVRPHACSAGVRAGQRADRRAGDPLAGAVCPLFCGDAEGLPRDRRLGSRE